VKSHTSGAPDGNALSLADGALRFATSIASTFGESWSHPHLQQPAATMTEANIKTKNDLASMLIFAFLSF
jgi:hypothetical protein